MNDKISIEIPKDTIYTINGVDHMNGEVVKKIERYRSFEDGTKKYRYWHGYVNSYTDGVHGGTYLTEKLKTLLPCTSTKKEQKEVIDRHMAGEKLKVLISEYQDKLNPSWECDLKNENQIKYFLKYDISSTLGELEVFNHYNHVEIKQPKEFYYSEEVAFSKDFLEKATPLYKKWIGVE